MNPEKLKEAISALLEETNLRLKRVGGTRIVEHPELADPDIAIISAGASSLLSEDSSRRAPALPEFRLAYTMQPYPHLIMLTALDPLSEKNAEIAPILWWIACVRSRLASVSRADLHAVVLIDGNNDAALRWQSLLECDHRFCRKLVWLTPPARGSLGDSAREFLDRTFLAQPWAEEERVGARGLDPFANLAESLASELGFSQGTIHDWLGLLARPDLAGRDLAEELMRAAERQDDR
jgi:hypothetical protein